MSSELEKYGSTGTLALRRSDAHDDVFVQTYMAGDETILVARKYTQSTTSAGIQLAIVGTIVGTSMVMATGSFGGAILAGCAALVMVALALALETSGRLVITDRALVVQSSVLLSRYQLAWIRDARAETLSPREWLGMDVRLFDPRDFFRASRGLRFHYAPPKKRPTEVFIAVADADEHLRYLASYRRTTPSLDVGL